MAENPIELKDDPERQLEYLASTTYLDRQEHEDDIETAQQTRGEDKKNEDDEEIKTIINGTLQKYMQRKTELAKMEGLEEGDYVALFETGSKEVHIALAKNSAIPKSVAKRLTASVYLAKKALFDNPQCDGEIKKELLKSFRKHERIYKEMLKSEE